jgi:4-coumarate--CoA ligase
MSTAPATPTLPIDLPKAAILRMLRPLLAQEVAAATGRRIDAAEAEAWPDDLALGEDGLGLDSLGVMACAAAVDRLFQLHETGAEGYLLLHRSLDAWAEIVGGALRHGVSGFTFATSGSTGAPRPCAHPLATLVAEAQGWADRFYDRRRIVLAVPAHHIYGCLFGVLLPSLAGIPVIERRGATPARLARDLAPGDLLVGFPAGLALLAKAAEALAAQEGVGLPPDLRATSSTAPLPAELAVALRGLGLAQLVEVYGSSETAGIGWRDTPDAAFRLLPRWRPGGSGDAASLVEVATGREMPLPDRAAWLPGGMLRPMGRKDHAVQVGGVNVWPSRVAAVLAEHPMVAAASVRLDAALAEPRLKAFVVPAPGAEAASLPGLLARWCAERMTPPERPVRFTLGAALPRGPMGKDADWDEATPVAA